MKSTLRALPYPVLGRSDDYTDSAFQTTIDVDKRIVGESEAIVMSYGFLLSSGEIAQLIESQQASFALDVSCTDTLYKKVYFFLHPENELL